jgi:hypothetical protein
MPTRRNAIQSALLLAITAGLAGCGGGGGSDDSSEGGAGGLFMQARINGQVVSFSNFAVAALYVQQGGPDRLLVAGAIQGNTGFPSMSIQIVDDRPIAPGTYGEPGDTLFFRYSPSVDENYVSTLGPEQDFRVNIASVSEGILRGSFAGTIRDEATEGRTTAWAVTDGSFALEIRRP